MTILNQLINELCPNGVQLKKLSQVLSIKNGKDYKSFGEGDIPVYGTGGIMTYIDHAVFEKPSVLIPRKGSIDKMYYVDVPFWTVDTIFYTDIRTELIEPKYVFHFLQSQHLEKLNTASGVPSLTQAVLNTVKIPLPPLPVQHEIVRILDKFTELSMELSKELTKELTARKKQYEYYRNQLIICSDDIKWKTLGEVCDLSAGGDVPKEHYSKEKTYEYTVPIYSNGIKENALYGYTDSAKIYIPSVTISARGTIGHSALRKEPYYPIIRLICAIPHKILYAEYLQYAVQTIKFQVPTSGIPQLTVPMIAKYRIPVPSLEDQQRIVAILDRFDPLCNDLTSGMIGEIDERRKQYEYYREKLFTFKEIVE